MQDEIFQERRARHDRRDARQPNGVIHCRRKVRDRRRGEQSAESRPWWLQTNYVERERLLYWKR